MRPTRLLIVDDHSIVRKGIMMYLRTEPTIEIVGEAESGLEAIRQVEALQPDVVLMDMVMADGDGITTTRQLKQTHPQLKIIILSTFKERENVQAVIAAGADGYMLKDADGEALVQAIEDVQNGDMPLHPSVARYLVEKAIPSNGHPHIETPLTEREKEVLGWVARGLSNKAVADVLSLSSGTVKVHVSNILGKLQVNSRTEAATLALQTGLIELPQELGVKI